MNNSSKVLSVLVIILVIVLIVITYYCFYWRKAYLMASEDITKTMEAIRDKGYDIIVEDNGQTFKMEKNTDE